MLTFAQCLCRQSGLPSGTLFQHLMAMSTMKCDGLTEIIDENDESIDTIRETRIEEVPIIIESIDNSIEIIKDELNGIC